MYTFFKEVQAANSGPEVVLLSAANKLSPASVSESGRKTFSSKKEKQKQKKNLYKVITDKLLSLTRL